MKALKLLDYPRRPRAQVCYLICFRDPATGRPRRYRHAGHYLGRTTAGHVDARLDQHRAGRGSLLVAVAVQAGLTFQLVRVWPGGAAKERQLKTRAGSLYCPDCSAVPQPGTAAPLPGAAYLTRRQRAARLQAPPAVPAWLAVASLPMTGTAFAQQPPY